MTLPLDDWATHFAQVHIYQHHRATAAGQQLAAPTNAFDELMKQRRNRKVRAREEREDG